MGHSRIISTTGKVEILPHDILVKQFSFKPTTRKGSQAKPVLAIAF